MRFILYSLFVLSGIAGLIYESIWSRYLGLFVGHSAYAQVIVLAIFLGGMSLGALLVAQRSARLREPLLWYAGTELAVGLLGFLFHNAFLTVTAAAYTYLLPALNSSSMLTLIKWGIASALILPQSILLGATFPFMSAGILRRASAQPGRVLAMLYFANSLGAASGGLLSGFVLIDFFGLPGTILTAGCLNVVVALGTYLAVRSSAAPAQQPTTAQPGEQEQEYAMASRPAVVPPRLWRLLLGVSFATAIASFIYEIAWIRFLSLVLGSATHAFELMLSAFILGLALGALWVRRRADQFREPLRALGTVQLLMGGLALATLPVYLASFDWMVALTQAFSKTAQGYVLFNVARYGLCLAVMLPATFCAGITLPLITRTLLAAGAGERAIGWVYGVNTLGAIAGVMLAALALMPWIGLKALLMVGATCDMAVGVLIFACLEQPVRQRLRLVGAACLSLGLVILLTGFGTTVNLLRLTSGVYRYGSRPVKDYELLFYKDGRTATVAGVRTIRNDLLRLSTNGKTDASLGSAWFKHPPGAARQPLQADAATQTLLALLSLAYAPQARQVAVVGQGSGQSSHLLLGSPHIERLVTIDIEPEMIAGSRIFYPANRRVFDDPRSHFAIDDARSFFAAHPQQYDLILSEPSNPWVSGVSSLFTSEFYAQVAPLLTTQGIFGQWLHLYELNDDLVLSVLKAVHEHFAAYEIFLLGRSDILIVASNQPMLPAPAWSVFSLPLITEDLRAYLPFTVESLEAMRLLDRTLLAPLLDHGVQSNSDFFPVLDLGAEQTRYLETQAEGIIGLSDTRFDIIAPWRHTRRAFGEVLYAPLVNQPRVQALALGHLLRTMEGSEQSLGSSADRELRMVVQRRWQWQHSLVGEQPPADWGAWLHETLAVEAALHRGTAGVADETFYNALHQYLALHTPPALVCDTLLFVEGLARWDFAVVTEAADRLLQPTLQGQGWLPMNQLREGAVVAKLLRGDASGAQQYFLALAEKEKQHVPDLRTRLLAAYVDHPEMLPQRLSFESQVTWQCPATQAVVPRLEKP